MEHLHELILHRMGPAGASVLEARTSSGACTNRG